MLMQQLEYKSCFSSCCHGQFLKPLILWSSVSNSTLKSDLSVDILERCQRETLLKFRFQIIFCVVVFHSVIFTIYPKKS